MRHSASTSPQPLFVLIKAKLALPGGKIPVLSHTSLHIPNPSQSLLLRLLGSFDHSSGTVSEACYESEYQGCDSEEMTRGAVTFWTNNLA